MTGGPDGPLESFPWPTRLGLHVVAPGARPRIRGFDVQGDLAQHYSFAEIVACLLTGETPGEKAGRALDVAAAFLAPLPASEAPGHAAVLARLGGAEPTGVVGAGAITLAEHSTAIVDAHRPWLEWVQVPDGDPPPGFAAGSAAERAAVRRLVAALDARDALALPAGHADPSPTAALLALLVACGLSHRESLISFLVVSRLPAALAEAAAVRPGSFAEYPMNTPAFRYRDPSEHAGESDRRAAS